MWCDCHLANLLYQLIRLVSYLYTMYIVLVIFCIMYKIFINIKCVKYSNVNKNFTKIIL